MNEELTQILRNYKDKVLARKEAYDLPPRPLNVKEVEGLIEGLEIDGLEKEKFTIFKSESVAKLIVRLLSEEVRRGTFPSSYVKAEGLTKVVKGEIKSDYLSSEEALKLLADMNGGAATDELINILKNGLFKEKITDILQETVLVNEQEFTKLAQMTNKEEAARKIIKSWAEREFAQDWRLKDVYQGVTIKVGDNLTTGHLSPSKRANSRTDQPLHAQYIMEGREDETDFLDRLEGLKEETDNVIFVAGSALGEGSSRKSATYTMLQILGEPVEGEPEKKAGGVVVAKSFAPIFKNSLIASGILPVECNTDDINEGDKLEIDIDNRELIINGDQELEIELPISFKLNKIAAGGMTYFDAGNELQKWAAEYCRKNGIEFDESKLPDQVCEEDEKPPQTLAQKIVGMNRLDGKDTILPGETATVQIRGVYSQDTTGPMTLDEYQSMAGGDFGAEFVVQSLCHTGECPSTEERNRHQFIDDFVTERGGVCLEPGEGIIHTIGNRFVLPTDVIVGGDSHTRTPRGVSFPAASDIVAGAMKYGKQDLTMDESVRVIFKGEPKEGITARDLVSTLVTYAKKTVGKDVYNGRIIEMEGVEFLNADERYILTNAVAERSASAGVIPSDEKTLEAIENNLEYLKSRPDSDTSPSVKNAISAIEEFLADPILLEADEDAEYAATIEIPLNEVEEPLVAKPHHPDNVAPISEVAGTELDEVFIGSCVGGDLEGIRAAARIVDSYRVPHDVNFVVSPAARDIYNRLAQDGSLAKLTAAGATIIMPGCGLCMGNKRRIGSGAVALTTTTRNYQSRIGPADSRTYLGSAYVAAMAAVLGKLPTVEEYFELLEI
ncbi:bifunctional aconitate hydratase 2/2-methylisocitrate dehydratase [Sporohalobacter salinus]|uniref:bifunctional aconitate hydratase 2/2-methylisocitrate dehydratase n=1 Tax=Sporohalobacter salinus TaxID=1494606 RepID=UPI00195FB324|nr:bifunctional aconitate hydratase 2/2-methylisocitrate dehydratase [Sporohalobacter salinus]MBM7624577.1 aconitate hydratase 2/2-methylisocitrate dehydratase [Sporohalobacter salinus]